MREFNDMKYMHYKIGAAKIPLIVFSVTWLFLFGLSIVAAILHPVSNVWTMMLTFLLIGAFLYVWLTSYRVEINGDKLLYNSLFGGKKIIRKSEIESFQVTLDLTPYATTENHGTLPPFRMIVSPKSGTNLGVIYINMGMLDRKGTPLLFKFLENVPEKK